MPVQPIPPDQIPTGKEVATLGGGCFWCLEAVFDDLAGVESVESGYMGGRNPEPSYEEVCGGDTGHAEVVRVTFDPAGDLVPRHPAGVLRDPRPDDAQPPGQRRRHAVSLRDLLPLARAEEGRRRGDRGARAREGVRRPDRDRGDAGGRLLGRRATITRTTSATTPASPTACGWWRRRSQKFRKQFLAKVKKAAR